MMPAGDWIFLTTAALIGVSPLAVSVAAGVITCKRLGRGTLLPGGNVRPHYFWSFFGGISNWNSVIRHARIAKTAPPWLLATAVLLALFALNGGTGHVVLSGLVLYLLVALFGPSIGVAFALWLHQRRARVAPWTTPSPNPREGNQDRGMK